MNIRNNTAQDLTFTVDIDKPVKFVNRLVIQGGRTVSVNIEKIIPMVLFDRAFQTAATGGTITLGYTVTDLTYLNNINNFLGGIL